jgi:hypothetical protein
MKRVCIIFLLIALVCRISECKNKKEILDEIIRKSVENINQEWIVPVESETGQSKIQKVCDRFVPQRNESKRTACCTPSDVRIVRNVLIHQKELHLFTNSPVGGFPTVDSVKQQATLKFGLPVKSRSEAFDMNKHCKSYFNGTLHVIGRSTVHNVYHASKFFSILFSELSKCLFCS